MELPELFYSLGDITEIGLPYTMSNPSNADNTLATIPIEAGSVKSIYVAVTMRSADNLHFAQFHIGNVFCNNAGVVTGKFQSDTIANRDNISNTFFFDIVGTDVLIKGNSGLLALQTDWLGMVSVIAV